MNPSSLFRPSNNRQRSHRAQSRRRAYADCQRESAGVFHLNEHLNLALYLQPAAGPSDPESIGNVERKRLTPSLATIIHSF
jgi:hypothetical protein